MISPDIAALNEVQKIVRERRFSAKHSAQDILDSLRFYKSTGTVMIDLHEGGIGSIRFREEALVPAEVKK